MCTRCKAGAVGECGRTRGLATKGLGGSRQKSERRTGSAWRLLAGGGQDQMRLLARDLPALRGSGFQRGSKEQRSEGIASGPRAPSHPSLSPHYPNPLTKSGSSTFRNTLRNKSHLSSYHSSLSHLLLLPGRLFNTQNRSPCFYPCPA